MGPPAAPLLYVSLTGQTSAKLDPTRRSAPSSRVGDAPPWGRARRSVQKVGKSAESRARAIIDLIV